MKYLSVLMILLIIFTNNLFAENDDQEKELRIINGEIKRLNLPWKTKRYYEEHKLGALLPLEREKITIKEIKKLVVLPDHLDWRDYNGENYITPVKYQAQCGSCWAFATVGMIEAIWKIERQKPDIDLDLSEQDLVSCSNAGNCIKGGDPAFAAEWVKNTGIVPEYCFPYLASDMPCNYCSEGNYLKTTIWGWNYITSDHEDVAAIKQALLTGPVAACMEVYADFDYYESGVYVKVPSAIFEGKHVVVIVGYDDALQCWIVKNSWGADFGENGFFRIRWGQTGLGYDNGGFMDLFGSFTIAVHGVNITKVGEDF
jgi:C1A family cysteine protease